MRALLRRAAAARLVPPRLQDTLAGRPRVNIQNSKGQAKAYQVRQVLEAINKLEDMNSTEEEQ
ncbi:hypothetical protein [Isoptericola rhizosphaerae]|uniref:hypothetical protein n=1 Tax=Isoptericola rhizosphaerae TaxID=3377837 RepID=UPI00383A862B